MKRFIIGVVLLLNFISARAQNVQTETDKEINAIYANAVNLLKNNQLFDANAELEKIIKLNPNHKDALYNLAIVSDKLGDAPSAIRFLLSDLKLNDKRAARLLVDKFNYKLTYADTMQNIDLSTQGKYLELKTRQVSSLTDLTNLILSKTSDKKEQLHIFLLWTHDNMRADAMRFFRGGNPLSNSEAFARRIGLCDEYANMMSEFCQAVNIPNYKVAGYVKYPSFNPGDTFTEANHAWNAVNLGSSWVLCDVFWSTVTLSNDNATEPHFIKRLNTNYFLGHPTAFVEDHLPTDPIFQFLNYPIVFKAFTKKADGIDTNLPKMKYLNYEDSLKMLFKLPANRRVLKIAQHAYEYNKDNPNDIIVEGYNYAADIVNKKAATKEELKEAKKNLTKVLAIIDLSKNEDIRGLKENCRNGISAIDRRLASK